MVYDLPLVEEKVKPHQVTTLHLISALAFIGTGAIIFVYNYVITYGGLALLIAGMLLLGLTIFKNKWITGSKINPAIRIIELILALCIAVYSALQHWKFPTGIFGALSAAIIFALYWERKTGSTLFVHVDENGLRLPVVRRRNIPWVDVEQVVLRFGTLTINLADNHLFQWNIEAGNVNSDVFEAFCNAKVEENRGKRRNDEW
jgi:hypothetical protein